MSAAPAWEMALKPQARRVLGLLRRDVLNVCAVQELPTIDGREPILRLAARIGELRKAGCSIRTRREANGTATYALISEPGERDARRRSDERRRARKRAAAVQESLFDLEAVAA